VITDQVKTTASFTEDWMQLKRRRGKVNKNILEQYIVFELKFT